MIRVRGEQPHVALAVAIAGIAVAVAITKPWSFGTDVPADSLGADVPSGSSASPSAGTPGGVPPAAREGGVIPLAGGGTLDCYDPPGWRLVLDATDGSLHVRTWLVVQPTRAAGPLDPSVPAAATASGPVVGLGFCAPASVVGRPRPAWTASVWRIDQGAQAHDLPRAARVARIQSPSGAGGLVPASTLPGSPATWAPGRYAVQFQARDGGAPDLWVIVDLSVMATGGGEGGAADRGRRTAGTG